MARDAEAIGETDIPLLPTDRNPTPTVDMMIELIDHPARAIVPNESHFHPNRNKF